MVIHYLMMGTERDQVWWGGCTDYLGITLEMDVYLWVQDPQRLTLVSSAGVSSCGHFL